MIAGAVAGCVMDDLLVDVGELRAQVREKYRAVATEPHGEFHFHTGRELAARLGYPAGVVDPLPDTAVESFAGAGTHCSCAPCTLASAWSTSGAAPGSTRSSPQGRSPQCGQDLRPCGPARASPCP